MLKNICTIIDKILKKKLEVEFFEGGVDWRQPLDEI